VVEVLIVWNEMQWTVNFFQYQATQWTNQILNSRSLEHQAYALRKESMWNRLGSWVEEFFNKLKSEYPKPLDVENDME
jgi:hypothetical protein